MPGLQIVVDDTFTRHLNIAPSLPRMDILEVYSSASGISGGVAPNFGSAGPGQVTEGISVNEQGYIVGAAFTDQILYPGFNFDDNDGLFVCVKIGPNKRTSDLFFLGDPTRTSANQIFMLGETAGTNGSNVYGRRSPLGGIGSTTSVQFSTGSGEYALIVGLERKEDGYAITGMFRDSTGTILERTNSTVGPFSFDGADPIFRIGRTREAGNNLTAPMSAWAAWSGQLTREERIQALEFFMTT